MAPACASGLRRGSTLAYALADGTSKPNPHRPGHPPIDTRASPDRLTQELEEPANDRELVLLRVISHGVLCQLTSCEDARPEQFLIRRAEFRHRDRLHIPSFRGINRVEK